MANTRAFVLTTVDTIFNENEFKTYIDAFTNAIENGVQAYMGVTPFVDDEKPLYVGTDNNLNITGFYDQNIHNCSYIVGRHIRTTPQNTTNLTPLHRTKTIAE